MIVVDALWVETDESLLEESVILFGATLSDSTEKTNLSEVQRDLSRRGFPIALCLSGGGIRSATFGLGVLQALAFSGVLERFHYLSTVSGGGFVGSWLSRWRLDARQKAEKSRLEAQRATKKAAEIREKVAEARAKADRTSGVARERAEARISKRVKAEDDARTSAKNHAEDADKHEWRQAKLVEREEISPHEMSPVRHLRSFSNYLSPAWGLSLDALAAFDVIVRKFLYNLSFWTMLFLALAMLARLIVGLVDLCGVASAFGFPSASLGSALVAFAVAPVGVLIVLALIFVIVLLPARDDVEFQEQLSRLSAYLLAVLIGSTGLFALFVIAPAALATYLERLTGKSGALIVALFGLATGLMGYWNKYGPDLRRRTRSAMDILGVRILDLFSLITLVGLALVASMAAHGVEISTKAYLSSNSKSISYVEALGKAPLTSAVWFAGLLAAALILSCLLGANRSSLHSFYSLRLIRAYLGTARCKRQVSRFTDVDLRDDIAIEKLRRLQNPAEPPVLFQIINMTLNLARGAGRRGDWQERRGAAFTATPLRTGSAQLGYVRSSDYAYQPDGLPFWRRLSLGRMLSRRRAMTSGRGLTLGRAMTISGAAASPNMGYYSSSLTALVMAILNIRLGWWLPNPKKAKAGERASLLHRMWRSIRRRDEQAGRKHFLRQADTKIGFFRVLSEGLTRLDAESDWIYLSDGGHFENLGLYEMVRRRCATILVVDAGCDGDLKYADLHNAIRKIQVDFSIPIDLPPSLPGQKGTGKEQRYVVGWIRYKAIDPALEDGRLYILKPLLTGNEPPSLIGYAEASRRGGFAFPHHSTADQFFNETQFESYRLLGVKSGEEVLKALAPRLCGTQPTSPLFYPGLAARNQPTDSTSTDSPEPGSTEPPEEPDTGTADAVTPPSSRVVGGAIETIRQMSAGQLAVSALGAVAAVTVAGNVADKVSNETPAVVSYIFKNLLSPADLPDEDGVGDAGENASTGDDGSGSNISDPFPHVAVDTRNFVTNQILTEELTKLRAEIALIPTPPSNLSEQLTSIKMRLSALEIKPTVSIADLKALSDQIKDLKGDINNTEKKITKAEENIKMVERKITTTQRRVGRLDPSNNVKGQ